MNPPVLVPPSPGHPLILYLTIHSQSLGAMFAQESPVDKKERAIYYLSKKFTITELKYSDVEKTCAALVWVLHRLRQYTLHYQTLLVNENDPIKYLLDRPALVGKLAKWKILISEFDVQFMPQKSVKGRAIADLLAENSGVSNDDDSFLDDCVLSVNEDSWKMFFDGAVNLSSSSTGVILISPDGQHFPVAAKLIFPCTNNVAKYETCILELQATIEMGVAKLMVFGDSTLIIL